ncbi:zinc-binding dehydrogenase [soil metagenome]
MGVPPTMRALVLSGTGPQHLAVRTVPTPSPGPRQLLARVDAAGICTSLIKLVAQGPEHSYLYGWDVETHPLILGDEGAVTITQVGDELRNQYEAGTRYVVQPAVDHAPINHRERYSNVESVHKLAVGYTLAGHLAEYILIGEEILEAGCLLPLPDGLAAAHAALSEPLSCVVSSQDHHLHLSQASPNAPREVFKGLKPGGVTVVVGAGAMGRMHVDVALGYRPRAVIVTDFLEARLARVRTLFAAKATAQGTALHTVQGGGEVRALIDHMSHHHGADDVIVAVGSPKAAQAAQTYGGRGSVLNLFGGFTASDRTVALDGNLVHYQETVVTGSSGGSPWDVARTLSLLQEGALEVAGHIAAVGDLDHAPELLRRVERREMDGKAVVYPHRRSETVLEVESWSLEDERAYLEAVRG